MRVAAESALEERIAHQGHLIFPRDRLVGQKRASQQWRSPQQRGEKSGVMRTASRSSGLPEPVTCTRSCCMAAMPLKECVRWFPFLVIAPGNRQSFCQNAFEMGFLSQIITSRAESR